MVNAEAALRQSLAGRYDLEEEIGRGGMSVVFRARDLKHHRTVALKVLRGEFSQQISTERFQREIEVVAGLSHPHILPLYDSGEADGLLYYVMPHVEGGSLRDRLAREGALPESEALRLAGEIAGALGYAHERGVIHRDVKPGNILLSGGHALLADFGVAHLASGAQKTLTEVGLALGTPAYLSPEQASGERDIDGRSDLYSLGCVLYEALTGVPPFAGDSVRAMLLHQIVDTPPSVRTLEEGISTSASAIVDTALRKEPDRRFQSGGQMSEALDIARHSGGFPALVLRRLGVRRRQADRIRKWIAAASIVAVAALFGSRAWLARDAEPPRAITRYVVLEYERDGASEWERDLGQRATELLREQLSGWNTISVVRGPALEGPMVEFQAAGLAQGTLAFGTSLAKRFDADYRLYVSASDPAAVSPTASDGGDRAVQVTAWVYHPARQMQIDEHSAVGSADSLPAVTAEIAMQLLDIEGDPREYPSLLTRSPDHRAHQEFQAAREALYSWRLAEADSLLRAAIVRDSAFALAHHLLAETMYWQMTRDEERMRELGPKIESHSRKADRSACGDGCAPESDRR